MQPPLTPSAVAAHLAALAALCLDAVQGLIAQARTLPPTCLHDAAGRELSEQIAQLHECYPFRAQRSLVKQVSAGVVATTDARSLMELGLRFRYTTRLLVTVLTASASATATPYVPVDVSACVLERAMRAVVADYPRLSIDPRLSTEPRTADLTAPLKREAGGLRPVFSLGDACDDACGDLLPDEPDERAAFLRALALRLGAGDQLLLGVNLILLILPADDEANRCCADSLGIVRGDNTEPGGDFDLSDFQHMAVRDGTNGRISLLLGSLHAQTVTLGGPCPIIRFGAGEEPRTRVHVMSRPGATSRNAALWGCRWTRCGAAAGHALELSRPPLRSHPHRSRPQHSRPADFHPAFPPRSDHRPKDDDATQRSSPLPTGPGRRPSGLRRALPSATRRHPADRPRGSRTSCLDRTVCERRRGDRPR